MSKAIYTFVERVEGWVYRVDGTCSKLFPSMDAARAAARISAIEQSQCGADESITFEDTFGRWHEPLFEYGTGDVNSMSFDPRLFNGQ